MPPPPAGFAIHGKPEAGRAVFLKRCAVCHGETGDGKGRVKLDPPARDLGDGERMSRRSDWEIYLVIRDGGKALGLSEKMLPWGNLVSEQELHDLVAFVRTLARHGADAEAGEEKTEGFRTSEPLTGNGTKSARVDAPDPRRPIARPAPAGR